MTDFLIKEHLELQKRAAERADWKEFANLQEAHSVLKTLFDATVKSIEEKLGAAVSDEDLKELKREWETALRDALSGIREHFTTANDQQSNALLSQVELMLSRDREVAANEAKRTRQQINFVILGAVLSIAGSIFVFWETAAR